MKNSTKFKLPVFFTIVALIGVALLGSNSLQAQCISSYSYTDNGNGNFSFTNTSTGGVNYYWTFGDGNNSSSASPNYTYTANGVYIACLTITDSNTSCSSVVCDSIVVTGVNGGGTPCNAVAGFTYTDNGNGNYSFNNTSTTGLTYFWYYGDGNSSSAYSPNHTFGANGTYVVTLYVADLLDSGCYDYQTATINVSGISNPTPCQAGFTIYPDSANPGNVIVINSSTGNNLSYFWNFGDGNTSTLQYPSYTYGAGGPFELCLTVTDSNGNCSSTYCDSINSGGIVLKQSGFTINVQAPTVTGIEEEVKLISEFNAYPNPVRNNLTIELNITERTEVEISVTDMLGSTVDVISKQEMEGSNKIYWNATNIPNGIYMLNIKTDDSLQVKKLILNK